MRGEKITGWAIELKGYNMPNMKQFQSGRILILTSATGFLIGLGAGYALWKYPGAVSLEAVQGTESQEVPVGSYTRDYAPEVQPSKFEALVTRSNQATGSGNYAAGRFSTANGEVDAPLVGIQSLTVGGQVVSPITVGGIALSRHAAPVDGLLGMNFLQNFEFSLDQQRSVLELKHRRDDGNVP